MSISFVNVNIYYNDTQWNKSVDSTILHGCCLSSWVLGVVVGAMMLPSNCRWNNVARVRLRLVVLIHVRSLRVSWHPHKWVLPIVMQTRDTIDVLLLLLRRLVRLLLRLGRLAVVPGIMALRPGGGLGSTASLLPHGCWSPCWLLSSLYGVHPVRIFWSLRTHSIRSSGPSPSRRRGGPE